MPKGEFEKRTEKVLKWFEKPENLLIFAVLAFGIGIRLYYFFITKSQPLWWDEAGYGTLAKNMVYHIWDGTDIVAGESLIRPFLFPFLWGALVKVGFGEVFVRFFLELIPSALSVVFVYLIGKEMYNKKIAIISTFVFSVLWIHLFYSMRLLTDIPSLALVLASIYLFVKSSNLGFNAKYFGWSMGLLSIATLIRYPNGLVFFVYLAYLIFTLRIDLIKKKAFWISGILGIVPILIFFVINYLTKGNIFPALLGSDYLKPVTESVAFDVLNFIPYYLKTALFIVFLFGLLVVLFEMIIGYDQIIKNKRLRSHLLLILLAGIVYSYFIFYLKGSDDRWLLTTSIFMMSLIAIGIEMAYGLLKKQGKVIAVVAVLAVLAIGAYQEISFADSMIKDKMGSFLQMRQGFEWLKANSPSDSIVLGQGIEAYAVYYAERRYAQLPENIEDVNDIFADYLIIQLFTPQPGYLQEYVLMNQDRLKVMAVFYEDAEQTQPRFIIYQIKNI